MATAYSTDTTTATSRPVIAGAIVPADQPALAATEAAAETIHLIDVNDPNEGLLAFLRSLPGDPLGHEWREVSGFAGRFCGRCGVDEDDEDDERRGRCNV